MALVGSYAGNCPKPDSDIDLVIVAVDSAQYLSDFSWVYDFGSSKKHQREDYGLVSSIRVWYEEGLEVEFGFTDKRWISLTLDAGTQCALSDGMQILFERGNILSDLLNREKK